MSGCCREHNCTRKNPVVIYRGDFGGDVYAVLDSRPVNERTRAATKRHVVTGAVEAFIRHNREWVLSVLDEEGKP